MPSSWRSEYSRWTTGRVWPEQVRGTDLVRGGGGEGGGEGVGVGMDVDAALFAIAGVVRCALRCVAMRCVRCGIEARVQRRRRRRDKYSVRVCERADGRASERAEGKKEKKRQTSARFRFSPLLSPSTHTHTHAMPKIISRSTITTSNETGQEADVVHAPASTTTPSLRVFYCLCGDFALVCDRPLSALTIRPLDGSHVLRNGGEKRTVYKITARQGDVLFLRRCVCAGAGHGSA